MGLANEYRRQRGWRAWDEALRALPPLEDTDVLDLGCGPGVVAAELVERGARVRGYDMDQELLGAARARGLPRATFEHADLRALPGTARGADGIWCSFAAAYLVDLAPVLRDWRERLRPGGWIALVEVDDLFGHEPLRPETRRLLDSYARESLEAGRHDFHTGRRLRPSLEAAGFTVTLERTLPDRELAADGPSPPEIVRAWDERLTRMRMLQRHCGPAFAPVRADFLACLERPDHRALCRILLCVAERA